MTAEKKKKFLINVLYAGSVTALVFILFKFCLVYLFPFIIGIMLAAAIQKPSKVISERFKLNSGKTASVLAVTVYILILAIVVFGIAWLYFKANDIYENLDKYISLINGYAERIRAFVESSKLSDEFKLKLSGYIDGFIEVLAEKILSILSGVISSFIKKLPAFSLSVVIAVFSGCYFAGNYRKIKMFFKEAFPEKYRIFFKKIVRISKENIFGMFKGYVFLSSVTFAVMSVFFFFFRMIHPIFSSLLISVVDVLPVFGAGTILLPWAILALLNGDMILALQLFMTYFTVTVLRNFLEPKIIGKQVGIHPLLALFFMFTGLGFFGFLGMITFPLCATVAIKYSVESFKEKYQYK